MHDRETRAQMDALCATMAELMLKVGHWKDRWTVTIDGCVFKINIDGYPKKGTPRWIERERELHEFLRG